MKATMASYAVVVACALGMGCGSEVGIGGDDEPVVQYNPRPLEATTQTDRLVQVQRPAVDVLWVVDNSCSMEPFQVALADNFSLFLDFFLGSGLDYHIGVVSTDMQSSTHRGHLQRGGSERYIDDATEDPIEVFAEMVSLGTGGSGTEAGLDASYAAIEKLGDEENTGFYREDATLHVINISDEEDHSSRITALEYVQWFRSLKWSEEHASVSSVVSLPGPLCSPESTVGDTYLAVTEATGGVKWDICTDDWSGLLENLGLNATGLKREYFLSRLPVEDTIQVRIETAEGIVRPMALAEWAYLPDRNSILFNTYVPEPYDTVVIDYHVLSGDVVTDLE